jgi:arginine decarboxylase
MEIGEGDPQVVVELGDLRETISVKTYREYYHDALEHREELFTMFNLGLISLEDRAKGEVLFWDVCERADKYAQQAKYVAEEFDELRRLLCAKYLTNFSVFRSVPDHWAIDQLFPIVPIHRLNKPPTEYATLCDITCDSDGIVDKFVDLHDVKQVLELHPLIEGEPYYISFMLVGAYQEVMGNNHNLFGTPHEAHIHIDEDGYLIKKVIRGTSIGEAAERARYERSMLHEGFRRLIAQRVKREELTEAQGAELVEYYESRFDAYTYLSINGEAPRGKR